MWVQSHAAHSSCSRDPLPSCEQRKFYIGDHRRYRRMFSQLDTCHSDPFYQMPGSQCQYVPLPQARRKMLMMASASAIQRCIVQKPGSAKKKMTRIAPRCTGKGPWFLSVLHYSHLLTTHYTNFTMLYSVKCPFWSSKVSRSLQPKHRSPLIPPVYPSSEGLDLLKGQTGRWLQVS